MCAKKSRMTNNPDKGKTWTFSTAPLSLLMPSIALPIRLYERRKGYLGHALETTLSGLTVRLEEDKRENLEEGYPSTSEISTLGQKMKVSIYAFKRGQSKKYTKKEGVIFTINGQTHGYLSQSFFSREQRVGLGYLKDSLLVIVDCSKFDGRAREDLFMTSRDRLRSCELRNKIEKNLEDLLKNHLGLKELKIQRRQEDIKGKLEDSKPLAEVIEQILKNSPTLSKLFVQGIRLPNPFKISKAKSQEKFIGKRYPNYFKLTKNYTRANPKKCPENVKLRLQYTTDAENDYFDRNTDPGSFKLVLNNSEIDDFSINLWNGIASLNVSLPIGNKSGDILHFRSEVQDISRIDPLRDEFFIEVIGSVKNNPYKSGKRKQPASNEKGDDVDQISYLQLPNVWGVRKDEWEKHNFDSESALKIVDSGDNGSDFYCNLDNIHLLTEQKASSTIDPKLVEARYKYGIVLIGLAFLNENKNPKGKKFPLDIEIDIYENIAYVTRIISPILLPMIAGLGDLVTEDVTLNYEEDS